jgi:hypothetical protein
MARMARRASRKSQQQALGADGNGITHMKTPEQMIALNKIQTRSHNEIHAADEIGAAGYTENKGANMLTRAIAADKTGGGFLEILEKCLPRV